MVVMHDRRVRLQNASSRLRKQSVTLRHACHVSSRFVTLVALIRCGHTRQASSNEYRLRLLGSSEFALIALILADAPLRRDRTACRSISLLNNPSVFFSNQPAGKKLRGASVVLSSIWSPVATLTLASAGGTALLDCCCGSARVNSDPTDSSACMSSADTMSSATHRRLLPSGWALCRSSGKPVTIIARTSASRRSPSWPSNPSPDLKC